MVIHTSINKHVIYTLLLLPAFLIVMQSLESVTASSNRSSCVRRERNALLHFKHSLIDHSNRLSSWIGDDCCNWVGIRCSERTGHVVELRLRNPIDYNSDDSYNLDDSIDDFKERNRLGGELDISLQNLKHLTHIDLSMNNFSGKIPDFFGSFMNLRYLNLSNLYLSGKIPDHLGNLSSLQYLDLSDNNGLENDDRLQWVSRLYLLKHLDLSEVDLSKATNWFPSINMLPSLSVLKLADCALDFTNMPTHSDINFTSLVSLDLSSNILKTNLNIVFDWLYNITGLLKLSLSVNNYGGPIPESIYTLRSLTFLDLSYNELKGPVPVEISELTQLRYLNLGYNKFSGNLPRSLIKLAFLEGLDIGGNMLSGTIPTFISELSKLERLDVGGNRMSGVISDDYFNNLTRLKHLNLSSNSYVTINFSSTWTPPFKLISLDLLSCKVGPSFPQWLRNQRNLEYLDLSNANIDDTIPLWVSSLNNLLSLRLYGNKIAGNSLLIHSNLMQLDVSDNLLSGLVVPNASNSLRGFYATNNLLRGAFPTWLCNMKTIFVIDLSDNQLSGRLPSCLGSLVNLIVLDLRNNSFYGNVPEFLGSLSILQFLQLRRNKFKGGLPSSFQNLTQLDLLDVGQNAITGIIPSWIGQTLSNLGVLNLRSNRFHGPIPQQLCHLSYLRMLNLAQNNISGSIPSCFHNLTFMIREQSTHYFRGEDVIEQLQAVEHPYNSLYFISMDLSSNNIVGMIPVELMELVRLVKL